MWLEFKLAHYDVQDISYSAIGTPHPISLSLYIYIYTMILIPNQNLVISQFKKDIGMKMVTIEIIVWGLFRKSLNKKKVP